MKEAVFLRWVVDVAKRFGWRCWHVPAPMRHSRTGGWVGAREAAGLADLILIHDDPPRLIFAEVKGSGSSYDVTDAQREFLTYVKEVGDVAIDLAADLPVRGSRIVGAYVWRPGMEDAIETVLRSRVLS